MHKLELTEQLMKDIRENVFGSCTVVYESMTISEMIADLQDYLAKGSVSKKTGNYVVRKLTPTSLEGWLKFRQRIEEYDIDPETPFDRSDEEILNAVDRTRALAKRLTTNVSKFIGELKK